MKPQYRFAGLLGSSWAHYLDWFIFRGKSNPAAAPLYSLCVRRSRVLTRRTILPRWRKDSSTTVRKTPRTNASVWGGILPYSSLLRYIQVSQRLGDVNKYKYCSLCSLWIGLQQCEPKDLGWDTFETVSMESASGIVFGFSIMDQSSRSLHCCPCLWVLVLYSDHFSAIEWIVAQKSLISWLILWLIRVRFPRVEWACEIALVRKCHILTVNEDGPRCCYWADSLARYFLNTLAVKFKYSCRGLQSLLHPLFPITKFRVAERGSTP